MQVPEEVAAAESLPVEVVPAAYGGSRIPDVDTLPPEPSPHAHDGRGVLPSTHAELAGELAPEDRDIAEAVGAQAEWMTGLLARLVDKPTTLGNEEVGQDVVREALHELGLQPVDVPMDPEALRAHAGHSPFDWDVSSKSNVVATWHPSHTDHGRSLILNGHIDVVSPEPVGRWHRDPFVAHVEDGWLYGRGAADMKCGLAAMLGAVKGLRELGLTPHAPITLQSVVEEECTGNGTLSCLLAGYSADAAVITEPFGAAITTSQVGVLWFRVRIEGLPGHAAESANAVNAIEKSLSMIQALRSLEAELNETPPPPYDRYDHPIGLNVGSIHGGDWPSTVPGECVTDYRIALFPGMRVRDLQDRIEAIVAEAAVDDPAIFAHPPVVEYRGFAVEGYDIPDDDDLVTTLSGAHARQTGESPVLVATTGTTDARIFGLYGGIPAVCFGPYAELAHGANERVWLPSVVQTAQVLGLFVRDWCGLSA
jgi:acetylornithine deacetylase